ncbi:MAG: SUMF1/EgtB/PvdO family nonheme iron enzyme [Gemmataceae bacterium]
MNADLSGLLEAIHERPADDALWLILADWLEEHDDPRKAALLRDVRGLRGVEEGPARLSAEARVQGLLCGGVVPCVPARTNSIGMELALVPPGVTWVGSPDDEDGRYGDEPRRRGELTAPFYLGVHAVTQAQYQRVMGDNPSAFSAKGRMRRKVEGLDTSRFPVERVSWADAAAFCQRLGELPEEKEAGRTYRLPTEVEWEFACRGEASQMTPFPYGPGISPKVVNYRASRRARSYLGRPAAVGSYPPNAFGLYEMVGNTWEWCADWYVSDAYGDMPPRDPPPPPETDRRNARGGTYALEQRRARSADRSSFEPSHRDIDCGLRVLMPWRGPPAKKPRKKKG